MSGPRFFPSTLAVLALAVLPSAGHAAPFDEDDDGILDPVDNCITLSNPDQVDSDGDGWGNGCDPDYDQDGFVDFGDYILLSNHWGHTCDPDCVDELDPVISVDGSGSVGGSSYILLSLLWGMPLPPTASCAGANADGDGWTDCVDSCPYDPNPGNQDSDGDGIGDVCDQLEPAGMPVGSFGSTPNLDFQTISDASGSTHVLYAVGSSVHHLREEGGVWMDGVAWQETEPGYDEPRYLALDFNDSGQLCAFWSTHESGPSATRRRYYGCIDGSGLLQAELVLQGTDWEARSSLAHDVDGNPFVMAYRHPGHPDDVERYGKYLNHNQRILRKEGGQWGSAFGGDPEVPPVRADFEDPESPNGVVSADPTTGILYLIRNECDAGEAGDPACGLSRDPVDIGDIGVVSWDPATGWGSLETKLFEVYEGPGLSLNVFPRSASIDASGNVHLLVRADGCIEAGCVGGANHQSYYVSGPVGGTWQKTLVWEEVGDSGPLRAPLLIDDEATVHFLTDDNADTVRYHRISGGTPSTETFYVGEHEGVFLRLAGPDQTPQIYVVATDPGGVNTVQTILP